LSNREPAVVDAAQAPQVSRTAVEQVGYEPLPGPRSSLVYSNTIDPITDYYTGDMLADDCTLAGTDRILTRYEVMVYAPGGAAYNLTVQLWNGSSAGGPTTPIAGTACTFTNLPLGYQTLACTVAPQAVAIPNTVLMVYDFSVTSNGPVCAGDTSDPGDVGSTSARVWEQLGGVWDVRWLTDPCVGFWIRIWAEGMQSCGNNIREGTEECDGTDDANCPGRCLQNCTCGPEPCELTCPPGSVPEQEVCGTSTNAGCGAHPPVFEPIACNSTVCGTSRVWEGGGVPYRDTDWYALNLAGPATVTVTVTAEFPALVILFDAGSANCADYTQVDAASATQVCDPISVTANLAAGWYWVWVGPTDWYTPVECGDNDLYLLEVQCTEPCDLACPPGSVPEQEACGADTNGGCGADPAVFESIACNRTVCGTFRLWDAGGYLDWDTDWYALDLTAATTVTVTLTAEFPALLMLFDAGSGDCIDYTQVGLATAAIVCEPVEVTANLDAGTYWVWVGPSDWSELVECGGSDLYTLQVECGEPCETFCPPGSLFEGEPDCHSGYVDTYNGGCDSVPQIFLTMACGESWCGRSGTYPYGPHSYRDTDWFAADMGVGDFSYTAQADFPLRIFVIDPGTGNCSDLSYTILATATASPCEFAEIAGTITEPTTLWLWIGPSVFTGVPCGTDWAASLECVPPPQCPPPAHFVPYPPDGSVDATRPHPISAQTPCAGVGTAWQPITINLGVSGADSLDCWELCETGYNTACGPNSITSVVEGPVGVYTINLAHGLSTGRTAGELGIGYVTTIRYNGVQYVTYYKHPANVDASAVVNANDITQVINRINIALGGGTVLTWEADIDTSGTVNLADLTTLIDLLNGASQYAVWFNTAKPDPTGCP